VDSAKCHLTLFSWPKRLICYENAQDFLAKLFFQNLLAAKLSFQFIPHFTTLLPIYGPKAAKLCFQAWQTMSKVTCFHQTVIPGLSVNCRMDMLNL